MRNDFKLEVNYWDNRNRKEDVQFKRKEDQSISERGFGEISRKRGRMGEGKNILIDYGET